MMSLYQSSEPGPVGAGFRGGTTGSRFFLGDKFWLLCARDFALPLSPGSSPPR